MKMDESDEEIIVYANFEDGTVAPEIFKQENLNFKAIGLNTDTPVIQLGDSTFKGNWVEVVGTKVLFEVDNNPEQVDHAFRVQPPIMYKYNCQTTKTLKLSRFFLKPKSKKECNDSDSSDNNVSDSGDMDVT